MREKRGQAEVVAVIIGIAIFSLLYIVFVPLSEKCKILPNMPECHAKIIKETVFEAQPGFLKSQLEHAYYSLKPVELFTSKEVELSTMLENVRTERTIFSNKIQTGIFKIYGRGEEVKLFIYVSDSQGSLKVKINGNQVGGISGDGIKVVNVPVEGLYGENIMVLESSIPILPWQTNFYGIDKVLIKEAYTLFKVSQTDTVNVEENLSDVENAKLRLWSDCLTKESLTILLNNAKIYDDSLCGSAILNVNLANLAKNNNFVFKSDGNYYVHDINLDLKFKANDYPTYYFDLTSENLESLSSGKRIAMLRMEFDSTQQKRFDLYVNGKLAVRAETSNLEWQTNLRGGLRGGQNSIKIIPRTNINILDMKVEIE